MNDCSFVNSIFYFLSQYVFQDKILCYLTAMLTCAGCAAAELVGRFKGGNGLKHILLGRTQTIFYILNALAGFSALFGSEALNSTEILKTASTDLMKAISQSALFAVVTFITLRTSISTLPSSKDGKKLEIGPGQLFAVLLEKVGYRIDLERARHLSQQIKTIDPLPTPRAVFNVILPYCFDQSENSHGNRRQELEQTLEKVMSGDRDVSPNERSALMLNHLLPIFGIEVIKSAVGLVSNDYIKQTNRIEDIGTSSPEMLQSTSNKLDSLYQQLTGKNE